MSIDFNSKNITSVCFFDGSTNKDIPYDTILSRDWDVCLLKTIKKNSSLLKEFNKKLKTFRELTSTSKVIVLVSEPNYTRSCHLWYHTNVMEYLSISLDKNLDTIETALHHCNWDMEELETLKLSGINETDKVDRVVMNHGLRHFDSYVQKKLKELIRNK